MKAALWIRKKVWSSLKWLLFHMEPETAHLVTVFLIRLGISLGGVPLRIASGASRKDFTISEDHSVRVMGLQFYSRVGLAAGFDKNCEILEGLPALGFSFAEIGTVTPRPQSGNPRPRLFRDIPHQAIFNRMGFNGLGAALVSERLRHLRERIPPGFQVGVNLGKNKDTPPESAAEDYSRAAKSFEDLADYLVINVSSPNTPGLRSLQTVSALKPIVGNVLDTMARWRRTPPLLLKLAPELSGSELADIVHAAESWGISGWVLTNTLGKTFQTEDKLLDGGLSGVPLSEYSRKSLALVRQMSSKPIISVGGIGSVEEAKARIQAGADLIQVYTGWIYGGPTFPIELRNSLKDVRPQMYKSPGDVSLPGLLQN